GTSRRLCQLSYAGMLLAAGVEPATSRLRSVCTAVVLRQQSSFRLAGNQRLRRLYRPSGRLMQRGAQPENSLIHASDLTRPPLRRRAVLPPRTPSGASERRTQISIVDWCCCGPFGPSACYGGGVWPAAG